MHFEEKCRKLVGEEYSAERSNTGIRDAVHSVAQAYLGRRSIRVTKLDTDNADSGVFQAEIKDLEFGKSYAVTIRVVPVTRYNQNRG